MDDRHGEKGCSPENRPPVLRAIHENGRGRADQQKQLQVPSYAIRFGRCAWAYHRACESQPYGIAGERVHHSGKADAHDTEVERTATIRSIRPTLPTHGDHRRGGVTLIGES